VADWQLPPGVSRGLWDYLHDPAIARNYDNSLAGSLLCEADQRFVECHCPAPGRLIDLGCGTGRLLLSQARRGLWVLGVDLSEEMLRVAREKAAAEGVEVHLLRANLTELDAVADASFDYAACLFSTLGMVSGREQRQRAIGHVFRILRPGGVFVLHVHNRWFNFWNRQGRRWLIRNTLASWFGRAEAGDCVMPVHQGIANLALHLFARREVRRLLRAAGFRIRELMPLSLKGDGRLRCPWWFGWVRAYGYLIAAEKPSQPC
jgi:ubiquinone/menaquinone biosynthesis C-methylase UbiE